MAGAAKLDSFGLAAGVLALLPSLATAHAQVRGDDFGRAVVGGIDVNRDGTPEVLVLESGWDAPECVWVLSGRTGAVLRKDAGEPQLDGWRNWPRSFSMASVGDFDGDGTEDYAYDRGDWSIGGIIVVRSGRSGDRLWAFPDRPSDGCAQMSLAQLGDLDGDGVQEIAVGMPLASGAEKHAGRCVVLSGKTRALRYTVEGPGEGAQFGNVCRLTDVDADGTREFLVWGPNQDGKQKSLGVFCGKNGSRRGWLEPSAGSRPRPSGVEAGFDWNSDGIGDIFVGCRGCGRADPHREELHVFSGKDLSELLVVPESLEMLDTSGWENFGTRSTGLRITPSGTARVLVVGVHGLFPKGGVHLLASGAADLGLVGRLQSNLNELSVPDEIMELEEQLHVGGDLANAGDLDHDGSDDLLVSNTAFCASQRGIVWAISGKTGDTIFRCHRRKGIDQPTSWTHTPAIK